MLRSNLLISAVKFTLASAVALTAAGCGKNDADAPTPAESARTTWPAVEIDGGGEFTSRNSAVIGRVVFADGPQGVLMRIDVSGLSEGWHGIHLHMTADCSDGADGFKKSGGHVNPDGAEHGLLNPAGAHRADIPNIYAGADGRATAEIYRAGVNLYPSEAGAAANGPYPLMDDDGFAVIIHAQADDHMTQPIGGAGDRIACAAIGG